MGIFNKKGIKPGHLKKTGGFEPVRIATIGEIKSITVPMKQHIGAPCQPTVKVGDEVKIGQIIGDTNAFMSAPIHAGISGTVQKIGNIQMPNGEIVCAVTINSDGKLQDFEGLHPPVCNSYEDFLAAVRASGLVGLGGAGFPTHVKLKVPEGKVDTLIINAAECEPYITADERECLDRTSDIIQGIAVVCKYLSLKNAIIGIENNKPSAISALKQAAESEASVSIKVIPLKSIYPQGAEKMLIYSLTGRRVPLGGLPSDVGCVVMNVASVAFLARYMRTGKPLVSRTVTVDGSAVKNPMNLRVPIGTSISDIISAVGGFSQEPEKLILGGPMMGTALPNAGYFISKSNNALLAFGKNDAGLKKETACIRCGKCVSVCPMGLMPVMLEKSQRCGDLEALKKYSVNACIECGCCSFTCPAGRQLVQSIRLGKAALRAAQEEAKKKEAAKNG